ncbi:Hypothetical_protein [Hexamita inflata]|uniref:Hypothetical_protein n=1 Tax=Hexamita inflata TaxID=28002 RepID=A0AA86UPK5_9EUKA|nr:Hypothetical protein HINF_LOCUS50819 [Hexamita inflata]
MLNQFQTRWLHGPTTCPIASSRLRSCAQTITPLKSLQLLARRVAVSRRAARNQVFFKRLHRLEWVSNRSISLGGYAQQFFYLFYLSTNGPCNMHHSFRLLRLVRELYFPNYFSRRFRFPFFGLSGQWQRWFSFILALISFPSNYNYRFKIFIQHSALYTTIIHVILKN